MWLTLIRTAPRSTGILDLWNSNLFEFLLPDVSHDNKEAFYGNAPHPVYDYLAPILDVWMEENDPGVVIPIFSELLRAMISGQPVRSECFGNPPLSYVIVNTDRSIEPLDALKVCADRITDIGANVFDNSLTCLLCDPTSLPMR